MEVLRGMTRLLETRKPVLMIEIEKRRDSMYLEVFGFLGGLSYEPYMTVDGIRLQRLDIDKLPTLQSTERLTRDWNGDRTFRRGEHKNYINNFFLFAVPSQASIPCKEFACDRPVNMPGKYN
jgi:hypothetical protein